MNDDNFISKTRRKKAMLDVQAMGVALTRLTAEQLKRFELPEALRTAIEDARRFTKHEALRRQMQYIGRLMRDIDIAPIAVQLQALHAPTHRQTSLFHFAEHWRAEILADPAAIARFVLEYPGADPESLRELAEQAAAERQAERAPRRYRELFQVLNAIVQEHSKKETQGQ
jgi:ribosome-associated protein